jgi:hypothetical protein
MDWAFIVAMALGQLVGAFSYHAWKNSRRPKVGVTILNGASGRYRIGPH